ncbi:MAG: phenylalanine--tRNA ligase subunit beta, partial [bacterium]
MLISYNWLRELTSTKLSPFELRERLTMVGLAIDSVEEKDGDSLLDVEVPSNRPDCLSHVGIAREVSVIERSKVQSPKSKVAKTQGKTSDFATVEIKDPSLCPRYAARVVRGVKIGPSPNWLVMRLNEIGQRPINNVADITNYVLHELGQPLHAFDLKKLSGPKIVVRRATGGEKLQTLDGVMRSLDPEMLVIADAEKPVALAGIMGGLDSEISAATVDVLIESAYFNPDSVRRTARKLGMDTEASRRFERGADCENVVNAQARCVNLICEIAGGFATEDVIDVYPNPQPARSISFRTESVERLTSLRVDVAEMDRILVALGFAANASASESRTFVVPSWRVDVSLEEDLVEEVARHVGYDKIGSELPPSDMAGEYQPAELKRRRLRRALSGLGFDEAINLSFIDAVHDDVFELAATRPSKQLSFVTLSNPILENATRMRSSLLPGLLQSVRHN